MKKYIALLLVAVMCLTLVACGNNEKMEKYKKYDTLIHYMEAEDYEGSVEEIMKISQESNHDSGAADDNGNTENKDDGFSQNLKSETIELTLDNWKDFFELRIVPEYMLNAFDEVETLVLSQFLVFKEEYSGRVTCNDVVIEMNIYLQDFSIKLHPTEQSYTLGEVVGERIGSLDTIETMSKSDTLGYYVGVFSNNYINAAENANPETIYNKTVLLVDSMDDIEAIRIKGTITINK